MRQRDVRVIPVSNAAKALELIALTVEIRHRKLAADLSQFHIGNRGGITDARLFASLEFRGKTMRIPTGHIRSLESRHIAMTHNDILKRFIQSRTEMNITVGIRRAVMQNEHGLTLVLLHQLLVDSILLPLLQHRGLALRESCLHRKFCFREIQRLFVILGHVIYSPKRKIVFYQNSSKFDTPD